MEVFPFQIFGTIYKESDCVNKILITGVSGLLGATLAIKLNETFLDTNKDTIIFGLYNSYQNLTNERLCIKAIKVDITDSAELRTLCQKVKPDIIIHCAALRDLELCAQQPKQAKLVNFEATKEIVNICNDLDTKLVFISTDMVFDGDEPKFIETSARKPMNVYGETKKLGEDCIMNNMDEGTWTIIRTSRLFGKHPLLRRNDFVGSVIEQLKRGQGLKLPVDEYRNNTYVKWAAEAIIKLYLKDVSGIFHVCGNECINKFDWGQMIAEEFKLHMDLILPIKMEDITSKVTRPGEVVLDNTKLRGELDEEEMMPSIREILRIMANEN